MVAEGAYEPAAARVQLGRDRAAQQEITQMFVNVAAGTTQVLLLLSPFAPLLLSRGTPQRTSLLVSAPLAALGLHYAVTNWLALVGVSASPGIQFTVTVIVGWSLCAAIMFWGRAEDLQQDGHAVEAPSELPTRHELTHRRSQYVAASVSLIAVVAFSAYLFGGLRFPPGWDAMNHGFMTRRIIETGSVDLPQICVTGPVGGDTTCQFYPLALNSLWATTESLGFTVSSSILGSLIVLGPTLLVIGLTGLLAAQTIGGWQAQIPVLLVGLTGPIWVSTLTGRITATMGVVAIPAAAYCLLKAIQVRSRMHFVLASLTIIGLVGLHAYETVLVALLVLASVVFLPTLRREFDRVAFYWLIKVAAVAGLIMLPIVPKLLGARSERTASAPPGGDDSLFTSVIRWLALSPEGKAWEWGGSSWFPWGFLLFVVSAAALLGLVVACTSWGAPARPWASVMLLAALLAAALEAGLDWPVINLTSSLFYSDSTRIGWVIALFRPVLAGITIVLVAQQISIRLPAKSVRPAARQMAPVLASAIILLSLALRPVGFFGKLVKDFSPLRSDLGAVAEVIGQERADGIPTGVVVDDRHHDGGVWLYADHGIPILFGVTLSEFEPDWVGRTRLLEALADSNCSDVAAFAEEYQATHVLVANGILWADSASPILTASALDSSECVEHVAETDGGSVYRIK